MMNGIKNFFSRFTKKQLLIACCGFVIFSAVMGLLFGKQPTNDNKVNESNIEKEVTKKYDTAWRFPGIDKGMYKAICVGFEDEACEGTIEEGKYIAKTVGGKDDKDNVPNVFTLWAVDNKMTLEELQPITPLLAFFGSDLKEQKELELKKGQYIYVEDIVTDGTGHLSIEKK